MISTPNSPEPATDLAGRFAAIVGADHVLTAAADMTPFLTDHRGQYTGRARALVKPATTTELAAVVAACAQAGMPMVPQGGNTGLCGGATPLDDGQSVLINLSRMNRIRALDDINDTICVEAGCTLASVQAAARAAGRLFPLTIASGGSCEIGGNVSTNAGGVQVLRYGVMRELVLGLEVVLPDGRIWNGLRALRKDNTGYDLKQLFIGAEGTLGFVTAAVLKLFPAPRARATAWVIVPDPASAVALLARFRESCGERVNAFELVSRAVLDLVLTHIPATRDPLPARADMPWAVLVELSDPLADAPLATLLETTLAAAIEAGEALDAVVAASLAQVEALWALRENANEAQRRAGSSIKHDISVPVSRIAEFIARADAALRARWPDARIIAYGHIGDGNLHYNLSASRAEACRREDNANFSGQVTRVVHDLADALGGSISAEHGLGQLKRDEIRRYRSEVELDLMRAIKSTLDPRGLMNPGKVLQSGS
ncbi:MAG: FAD-binding oxidoreductase [Azoarcus sp.]|jgi:FAD/FMN-containing dehydrogenase|nr:FAD-binding oxidoreductase [Azoarcus sp.]